jgi:hypothetical protein
MLSFRLSMFRTSFSRSLGMGINPQPQSTGNSSHQAGNHRVIDMAAASSPGRATFFINEIGVRIIPFSDASARQLL